LVDRDRVVVSDDGVESPDRAKTREVISEGIRVGSLDAEAGIVDEVTALEVAIDNGLDRAAVIRDVRVVDDPRVERFGDSRCAATCRGTDGAPTYTERRQSPS